MSLYCYVEILQNSPQQQILHEANRRAVRTMGRPGYEAQLPTHTVKSDSNDWRVYLPPAAISEDP